MKQFWEDIKFVVIDVLESIGDLIVYTFLAIKWIISDFCDAVIETIEAIREGRD